MGARAGEGAHSADGGAAKAAAERDEAREHLAAAEARVAELQATLDAKASPEDVAQACARTAASDALMHRDCSLSRLRGVA